MLFFTDCGGGAVAGDDEGLFWQWEQAAVDGVDDLAGVATGQVGAADGACEERVSGDEEIERRKVEADAALGVAWGVDDFSGKRFEADTHAVLKAGVWGFGFWCGNAEPAGLRLHHGEEREIIFVEENGGTCEALELECSADVIDVGVGDEDLLEGEA